MDNTYILGLSGNENFTITVLRTSSRNCGIHDYECHHNRGFAENIHS